MVSWACLLCRDELYSVFFYEANVYRRDHFIYAGFSESSHQSQLLHAYLTNFPTMTKKAKDKQPLINC